MSNALSPFVVLSPTFGTFPCGPSDPGAQMVFVFQPGLQIPQSSIVVTTESVLAVDPASGYSVPVSNYWVCVQPSLVLGDEPVLFQSDQNLHFSLGPSQSGD